MKVCGVIAEYDPFHRGHLYHLEQARKSSGADFMVCALGGAFSQRGEAMLFSTHDRAKMALNNGFDLVLGMPVSFSCAQANRFAAGGVGILESLGVVTHLSFGTESDSLELLQTAASLLNRPDAAFAETLRERLTKGLSFAAAQGEALKAALPTSDAALLRSPNFILGVSYLRELERLRSGILPVPVLRRGAYHGRAGGELASASAVRERLLAGDLEQAAASCPEASLEIIRQAKTHRPEALDKALMYHLLSQGADRLRMSGEISEGLEKRILKAARQAVSREELIDLVKTRRYPRTRISRALTHSLLNLAHTPDRPHYARLLGFRERAKPLLAAIAEQGFPLVTRPARADIPEVSQDLRAEELWYLGSGQGARAAWQQQVFILKEESK